MEGHELTESIAAVVLVISGLVFVAASWWAYRGHQTDVRGDRSTAATSEADAAAMTPPLLIVAAALSVGAASIHFAAVPPHMDEFPPFAYAFAMLAVAQLVSAVGLIRGWPLVRAATVVISVGVIGVWIVSRIIGLPVGAEPWVPEEVGLADTISSLFEAAIVMLVISASARPTWRSERARRVGASIYVALIPALGLVMVVTLIAVAALGGESAMHMDS